MAIRGRVGDTCTTSKRLGGFAVLHGECDEAWTADTSCALYERSFRTDARLGESQAKCTGPMALVSGAFKQIRHVSASESRL